MPPEVLPPKSQAHAQSLIGMATSRDMKGFDNYLDRAVRVAYNELPSFVNRTKSLVEFRAQLLTAEFYNVLAKFLACGREQKNQNQCQPNPMSMPFEFQPIVSIEDIQDEVKRDEANDIAKSNDLNMFHLSTSAWMSCSRKKIRNRCRGLHNNFKMSYATGQLLRCPEGSMQGRGAVHGYSGGVGYVHFTKEAQATCNAR